MSEMPFDTSEPDIQVLYGNLNTDLFLDLYAAILDNLEAQYELFKKSDDFFVLKEDINRQVKLEEVMAEGGFLKI